MRIKRGVSLKGLSPQAAVGTQIVDSVYMRVVGHEFTMTSGSEGKHKRGSRHYVGHAFDCRIWDVPAEKLGDLHKELALELGDEWDVVLERTHIHCEWEPKT